MPSTPARMFEQLGVTEDGLKTWDSAKCFGGLPAGTKVTKGEALFPRIDIKKELESLAQLKAAQGKEAAETKAQEQASKAEEELIDIDQFAKIHLKVARVTAAERVKRSDKLLKIQLKLGNEERTVVSGIAQYYQPEELLGKSVVLVANLKPAKLKGILSEGMLLCADDGKGGLKLLTTDGEMADGAEIG